MNFLTMENLTKCFEAAKEHGMEYVGIALKFPDAEGTELIINDSYNFDYKLEYYKKTYNDELGHDKVPGLQIVGFTYGNSLAEIEEDLMNPEIPEYIYIKFQEGPIKENGVNGVQVEDVINVLVNRLDGFQKGGFPCRENALAITKLEEARLWLNERTRKREEQNVEGKNEVHMS